MVIQSKRAREIDAWIEEHESCLKGKQKVEIDGRIKFLDSYDLPLDLLLYNTRNGRFNLEIQEHETILGRRLDNTDNEDVKKIKELLLKDEVETKKLKDDLEQLGEQREVAAITHDGVVVNGNRRMATIEELHTKHNKGWDKLWVVRLPEDISEKDLWKIEAGLQLSKEKVADYGPVNNLLMIREGKKAGLTNSEIAASMYGWTEKQVGADIERLGLMDIFLEFMGGSNVGNYGLIEKFQLSEHFINIQKGLVEKLKTSGVPKKDVLKQLEIIFPFLRAKIISPDILDLTHMDVREICKILQDAKVSYVLTEMFDKYKDVKQIPAGTLIDNLDKAKDTRKNIEYQQKPTVLIDKAIRALEGVDKKAESFKSEEVRKKLATLSAKVGYLRS